LEETTVTQSDIPQCCIDAGEAYFLKRFPLEVRGAEDLLRNQLLKIAKKWGPIAQVVTQGTFIRTVSSDISADDVLPYFNAEMRTLRCPRGHDYAFALLGRRIYYLVWRIHMICLSFFQESVQTETGADFSGPAEWPGPEQVEQLKLALRMYRADTFLSNEGFGDIYKWNLEAPPKLAVQHLAVSELALLFILFHEFQHGMEAFHEMNPALPPVVHMKLQIEGLGSKQHKNWVSEMQADCNALYMLTVSVASVLHEKLSMTKENARTTASSLATQGADLVLHSLEFVERQTYGKVDVEKARSMLAFLTHPPCDLRRKALSYTSYQLVTGKPYAMLFAGHSTAEWQQVAQDCASQIAIRERLFSAAEA
jgi:hypothetical protein